MKPIIPIIILHRNDITNLNLMLKSLKLNTRYSHQIFLIDNFSTPKIIEELKLLENSYKDLNIIFSKKNNWLLGFNLAFKHPKWREENYQYYIFSDCDIEVPYLEGKCWLERMVDEMNMNRCIGKLGIALKYSDIDKGELYEKVTKQELFFDTQPKIGNNNIVPVDTTLAIYRKDLFVMNKFKLSIGHASLVRPYYYTCRTDRNLIEARHLGWYNRGVTNNTTEQLKDKIICFSNYAAYIEPIVCERMPKKYLLYYRIIKPLAKLYWSSKVLRSLIIYYVKNFPKNINQIQNKIR